ncbi:carboxypeptidase-like regulatory domain-containing protein [Flavobacterium sp. ST-75]|uniref:Carboxypeptidase-like regulatory domain-containing protein n=1 Tax=Flavobacterium rhizophilum TaxID=3163296 RepID=A0ABW8YFU7_9FLAO
MKSHTLYLLLFFISFNTIAQTAIKSKLTDVNNNPVAFANVYIPESKKTTLSNESGDFYMVINPETDKTVIISHLSYQPVQIKITSSFPKNIVLEEGSLQLNEVVIGKQITGYDIALKVVENLKENHDADPAYYEYFTRVVQYDDNWKEIDMIQEYYGKLKHTGNHDNKALIYKSRVVPYTKAGEEILQTDSSIDLWGIRSNNLLLYKPDYLKRAKLKNYNISTEGSITINGHECYILKYASDKISYSEYKKAILYIDKETFGIVKQISGSHSTQAVTYTERNFVKINGKWVMSAATNKHHLHKIITTLYTYLTDKKDYEDINFIRTPFHKKLKRFNKNPNDTFWDNYQHIPLPEN